MNDELKTLRDAIHDAYQAAGEMAETMLQVSFFRDQQPPQAVCYAGDDDEGADQAREAAAVEVRELARDQANRELWRLRDTLETQTQQLIPTFEPIADLLQFSHAELEEFVLPGDSGRDLRMPLTTLGCRLGHWARQFRRDETQAGECPYTDATHSQVLSRIAAEKSRLMRDCVPYLEFAGAAEPVADQAGGTKRGRHTHRSNHGKNASVCVDDERATTTGSAQAKRTGTKGGRPRMIDDQAFAEMLRYRTDFESAKSTGGFEFDGWLRHHSINRKEHERRMNNTTPSKLERRNLAE